MMATQTARRVSFARVPRSDGKGYWLVDLVRGYCSCPAWKFQKRPPSQRTCKHLDRLAREQFDLAA